MRSKLDADRLASEAVAVAENARREADVSVKNAAAKGTAEAQDAARAAALEAHRRGLESAALQERAALSGVADDIGPSMSMVEHGSIVQRALQGAYQQFKQIASEMYGGVDALPSVSTGKVKAVAQELADALEGTGGIVGGDEATKAIQMLRRMVGIFDDEGVQIA